MKTHLRSFLGTVGYYRKFIPKFADMAKSLTSATCKLSPKNIDWTEKMSTDYKSLCVSLCSVGVLTVVFVVQTDASGVGISGVLSVCRDGQELLMGFYSVN